MNICESLTVNAKIFPDQIAIVFDGKKITYSELNRLSICAADFLSDKGIRSGDLVALMLPNSPSFPIWYYAVLRIGGIAVSLSTRLAVSEVEFIVSDCEAAAFVGSSESFRAVEPELSGNVKVLFGVDDINGEPESDVPWNDAVGSNDQWYHAEPDEAALILYTSGTTGFPKGATLSHGNVRSNVHAFNHLCNMQTQDVVLLAVPLFHCFGQNALLNSVLNVGGTIVLQQRFDLNESKQLITEHRVTQLYGVPMMFGLLLESCSPNDLATVNYCFSAAATLPIQTSDAWQAKFDQPIFEGYGLTETSPFATYNHRNKFVPGSIGMPIDSVEIRVVDTETGKECPPGELGEIAIRGPNVMLGYWNRPAETKAAIRNGWFFSGDIGRIDDDGYLFIVDRVKDMITVGGLKVFPAEVERVLLDHEAVSQAAVVGAPDSVFGEQVIGYVVLNDGFDTVNSLAEIESHAKSKLGNYKVPRRLFAKEELPRNPSGKILKTVLRETAVGDLSIVDSPRETASSTGSSPNPASLAAKLNSTFASEKQRVASEFLQEQICEIAEMDSAPGIEVSFIEAGLDSLAIVELSAQLQVEVGPEHVLPPTLLFDYPQIRDLAEFLVEILGEPTGKPVANDNQTDQLRSEADGLRSEIESMSEEEALAELMKELG